jgi:hypothetical protein
MIECSHSIAHPRTKMIEFGHTPSRDGIMMRSRWFVVVVAFAASSDSFRAIYSLVGAVPGWCYGVAHVDAVEQVACYRILIVITIAIAILSLSVLVNSQWSSTQGNRARIGMLRHEKMAERQYHRGAIEDVKEDGSGEGVGDEGFVDGGEGYDVEEVGECDATDSAWVEGEPFFGLECCANVGAGG